MKNPRRHLLFGVHGSYGIQNDRLDLTKNDLSTVCKTMHCGLRFFQFFGFFLTNIFANISCQSAAF